MRRDINGKWNRPINIRWGSKGYIYNAFSYAGYFVWIIFIKMKNITILLVITTEVVSIKSQYYKL